MKDIYTFLDETPDPIPIPKKINDNSPKGGTRIIKDEKVIKD